MSINQINTKQLHNAILSGCQYLVSKGSHLNRINVFPVADGDTGDNMASTAKAILTFSSEQSLIHDTLKSVANASVIGARGNSGIIFSQFFNALAENTLKKEHMDMHDFSMLLTEAAKKVRKAIATPIEGTILTAIEVWAKALDATRNQSQVFKDAMSEVLPTLRHAVENTKETLSTLKSADVVDAGALGFYYFVNGFSDCLNKIKKPESIVQNLDDETVCCDQHTPPSLENPPKQRYCTEAVVSASLIDKANITAILEKYGDSAVLTGNNELCRFHVHTNSPHLIFNEMAHQGTIQYPKIDDMQRQYDTIHQQKYKIALVTDSSADIPKTLQDQYQIHQLPLNLHLDNNHLLDPYCIDSNQFYQTILNLNEHPKTSCPSPAYIKEKLQYLSLHYQHVLILSLSKALSGTYDAIASAAKNYSNIKVIDSKTTSGAQGLLVNYAAKLISEGHSFENIVRLVESARRNTSIFVLVDQLDCLVRSGRVNSLANRLAHFTGVQPIVSIDSTGSAIVYKKMFRSKRSLEKLIAISQESINYNQQALSQYCIVHAGAKDKALELAELTTVAFNQPPSYIESVSPVIGIHAGKGCVAIATQLEHSEK